MMLTDRLSRVSQQDDYHRGQADSLRHTLDLIESIDSKARPPTYKQVLKTPGEEVDDDPPSPASPAGPEDAPGQTPDLPEF